MSYHCQNCQSLFFKTLETRLAEEGQAILYKKRCKRCKYKYLVRKELAVGSVQPIPYEEWMQGTRITLPSGKVSERPKVLCSEYSLRISQKTEKTIDYLHKLDVAKGHGHDASQAAV